MAYRSRQFKDNKKNYVTHDLDLAAFVFALKMWRHYLYGEKFGVHLDHRSLQYLLTEGNEHATEEMNGVYKGLRFSDQVPSE